MRHTFILFTGSKIHAILFILAKNISHLQIFQNLAPFFFLQENPENMWLANLGMNIDKYKITSTEYLERLCNDQNMERMDPVHIATPATNTLGLPLMKQVGKYSKIR